MTSMLAGSLPYATEKRATYENFEARCPLCGFWNIFNRVTDLKDVTLISFRTVQCLEPTCGRSFNINGDLVNPAHHMFIMECYALMAEKRYAHCIVSLAQAYELFFSHFLHDRLVLRPFHLDPDYPSARDFQSTSGRLYSEIEHLGYRKLRNVFFRVLLTAPNPRTLKEAQLIVATLPTLRTDPSDDVLASHPEQAVAPLLLALKGNSVAGLRNRVAHQEGYRPSLHEVEAAIEETRSIIFPLGVHLSLS